MSAKFWAILSLFFLLTAFVLAPFAATNSENPLYFRAWIGSALLTAGTFWQAKRTKK